MASIPSTPSRARARIAETPEGTPVTARIAASQSHVPSSPAYTTTRRHSLYGTEDRVVLDLGSRIWRVGFSGEGRPRDVFFAGGEEAYPLWTLERAVDQAQREEDARLLEARVQQRLRSVFHESLLTDPKSRKVLVVEHPLLPLQVKEMIARILFNNLQVPSVSFAPSSLLSLMALGRITGLVVDCGHLETTVLPIFSSRPLFSNLRSTPLAGSRFSLHLRALLLLFGTYLPPPTTLSGAVNIPSSSRATRVPEEILTETLIETIKARVCFVGEPIASSADDFPMDIHTGVNTPDPGMGGMGSGSEVDLPPSGAPSESDFSRVSSQPQSQGASQSGAASDFSVVSHSQARPYLGTTSSQGEGGGGDESRLDALASMYQRHSTATDIRMHVVPPKSQQTGTGRGTLIMPGWVRERAAEVLFEGGDVDEASVAEVILDALLKVPIDLRRLMAASIVLTGGTAMLPGFIPRLHAELLKAMDPPPHSTKQPTRYVSGRRNLPPVPSYDRYAPLRPLVSYFAILNNPAPPTSETSAATKAGKTPAFAPASLAWVGGSLAGALKISGWEVPRERWDEADPSQFDQDEDAMLVDQQRPTLASVLPDWTRTPLPIGAPGANAMLRVPLVHISSPARAAVGA